METPDSRNCIAFTLDSHLEVGTIFLIFRLQGNISVADRSEEACVVS